MSDVYIWCVGVQDVKDCLNTFNATSITPSSKINDGHIRRFVKVGAAKFNEVLCKHDSVPEDKSKVSKNTATILHAAICNYAAWEILVLIGAPEGPVAIAKEKWESVYQRYDNTRSALACEAKASIGKCVDLRKKPSCDEWFLDDGEVF